MPAISDRTAEHWYILCYIESQKHAYQRLCNIKNLRFYAPVFFTEEHKNNRAETIIFRNYAFVYGSQNYIYELKRLDLSGFNFIQSMSGDSTQHPYVSEFEIEQMKKVEKINDGKIPVTFSTDDVIEGDTIEILSGEFKGFTATAITKNGSKFRQTYLCINNLLTIPLAKLTKEEFRIISYTPRKKSSLDFSLTKDETTFIANALKRHYGILPSDETTRLSDKTGMKLLTERYGEMATTSPNTRLRIHTLLAVAAVIEGNEDACYQNLNRASSLPQEDVTKSTRLFYHVFRYLCTQHNDYFLELSSQITERKGSCTRSMQAFIELAEQIHNLQISRKRQTPILTEFSGDEAEEHWFCLTAHKKKTDAVKSFRDKGIQTFTPVLSEQANSTEVAKKNILKDIFFVRTTYKELKNFLATGFDLSLKTCASNNRKAIITYADDEISTFDYVNTLNDIKKEILRLTPQQENVILSSPKRAVRLGGKEVAGVLRASKIGKKTQSKLLLTLRGVITIAISLQ